MMSKIREVCILAGIATFLTTASWAADIGVAAKKLIVIDKLTAASKAKAVFVAKDPNIDKGLGTDVTMISVDFDASYDAETGQFVIPAGASDGTEGWVVNKENVAKYVNKGAPEGSTAAKVAVIKPGKLAKLVAKERGDGDPLDVVAAGPPSGSVFTSYCVTNGPDTNCHCTEFPSCVHKIIAAETGAKLVCKGGLPDPECAGSCPGIDAADIFSLLSTVGSACIPPFQIDVIIDTLDVCFDSMCDEGTGCGVPYAFDVANIILGAGIFDAQVETSAFSMDFGSTLFGDCTVDVGAGAFDVEGTFSTSPVGEDIIMIDSVDNVSISNVTGFALSGCGGFLADVASLLSTFIIDVAEDALADQLNANFAGAVVCGVPTS